ncbi:hypothetical protein AALO_G00233220 [Alosa alosa]|uniref:Uncharacterized protein n=1 Tax=Alosa alosa TaxID=278164 RepID=A0AAV6FUM6_9TELE|nr:hypothetical protein AALO_G00233220 [Alosa alosa]
MIRGGRSVHPSPYRLPVSGAVRRSAGERQAEQLAVDRANGINLEELHKVRIAEIAGLEGRRLTNREPRRV